MKYLELAGLYELLEKTSGKLEKRDMLADFYKKSDSLREIVMLSMGIVSNEDLGLAKEIVKKIIAKASGSARVEQIFKETGDLGKTAEMLIENKKQASLAKHNLSVEKVFKNLSTLPSVSGPGSQERKTELVVELLSQSSPKEARYIVRTVLGDMRIGVAAGIVRDAIALAFGKDPKQVEDAFNVMGSYGEVAEMARKGRLKSEIILFNPVRVMLADRSPGLKAALEKFGEPACEFKYDGFRIQCHKDGKKVKIFSRRLDEVSNQFPDIVKYVKENISAGQCIIEGEAVAVDKNGNPRPFQHLSRRIQRKYHIEKMVKEIPLIVYLFDVIYLNGKSLMDAPLRERWETLNKIVEKARNFCFASHLKTNNLKEAEAFYESSLKSGQEGLIVKNLEAGYNPGKRVGYWLKVKPIMEPLDLVVIGGEWGEGKRASWIGSLILACKKDDKFIPTGRMASGLTEQQMEELTKLLKKIITQEQGKIISVRPEIVIEVGYEEIQKSPKYPSGYALRFPRLLRIRDDKGVNDINTVQDIKKIFDMQRGRTGKK